MTALAIPMLLIYSVNKKYIIFKKEKPYSIGKLLMNINNPSFFTKKEWRKMYTVLVVDDTVENLDILSEILKDEYGVKVATNGILALKIAEKTLPDIILLDIMMPGMDGYEVCMKLKNNPLTKQIPVIFISAKNQEVDEITGFALGAVDYITKPISSIITKARIKTHLALSDQKKGLEIEVKAKTKEIYETRLELIHKLSKAAEYKDDATGRHIERVSKYSYIIGKKYGLNENGCELLLNASAMHDIGKIGIPDHILQKPERLTPEEFNIIKTHSLIGSEIIGESTSELINVARIIALQHHEKWDGTGYPQGLKGEQISIFARITAVADVFDALTSRRPYKSAWLIEKSINWIIGQAGEHFDPKVIEAFSNALPQILDTEKNLKD